MSGSDVSTTTLTSTSAQILYPILVNGYLCNNATEVQAARSGENPSAQANAAAASGSGTSTPAPAVSRTQTDYAVQAPTAGSGSSQTRDGTSQHHGTDLFA